MKLNKATKPSYWCVPLSANQESKKVIKIKSQTKKSNKCLWVRIEAQRNKEKNTKKIKSHIEIKLTISRALFYQKEEKQHI